MSGRVAVMRCVFGLIVVGIVGLQPAPAGAQAGGGGWGNLSGVVTDEQGNPIAGAVINLTPDRRGAPRLTSIRTGGGGQYTFGVSGPLLPGERPGEPGTMPGRLTPGRYHLRVSKPGFELYMVAFNIAGDMDTTHNVVLKRKVTPGFILYINGGFGRTGFTNVENDVCSNKVIPDFKTAGFDDFSCSAESVSNGWHVGVGAKTRIGGRFGLQGGLAYRDQGGPRTEYRGTRVRNDLFFRGGGNYDLKTWQVSIGPSININDNLAFSVSALGDWWTSDFDIRNQNQSAGQVVSDSNAAGSHSGFAVNFGAALEWYVGGSPVGLRVEGQSRRIDDVVKTDVTGLPKDDRGYTLSAGVVVRLRR